MILEANFTEILIPKDLRIPNGNVTILKCFTLYIKVDAIIPIVWQKMGIRSPPVGGIINLPGLILSGIFMLTLFTIFTNPNPKKKAINGATPENLHDCLLTGLYVSCQEWKVYLRQSQIHREVVAESYGS
jgi:hypothetical protein